MEIPLNVAFKPSLKTSQYPELCFKFLPDLWQVITIGWGYTHDRRANKYLYPHDCRADKDSYPHDRNVTNDLCSLIKLCFAFVMVNCST